MKESRSLTMEKSLSFKQAHRRSLKDILKKYWQLYLLFIPVVIWYVLFSYKPMLNVTIAFKKFSVIRGIAGSPWVGWDNFNQMFAAPMFWRAFRNMLIISAQNLVFGFPAPIIFALLLNEISAPKFKKTVQTISYLPHFISWSVAGGLVYMLLSLNTGTINNVIAAFGGQPQNFIGMNSAFRKIVVVSGIWKSLGWSAIVYLAAITGVDEQLYDAAYIDGAGRMARLWHVTLPGIRSTISVMLILQVGNILSVNFDQIYILLNEMVYETGETLDYYIYRVGLYSTNNFSMATAVGLIKSLIGFVLVLGTNLITKRMTDGEGGIW
ncbi:MAG: sugar ABC transporter permease [Clostridia bacterium]|nr:sugar ABC transporter permease [Clostridia bacterium]